ncbi:hypothetical protein TH53_00110 [Pedobacter lusitanus]|uniref:Uncharacterized protein n=1 Tax=Pedobacter lusitanus TaxID=1503925 RepID=A0A0D0GP10_9SPHI|nr:hypothetical protein TH53_00110 [Pedobacter lusitanus]
MKESFFAMIVYTNPTSHHTKIKKKYTMKNSRFGAIILYLLWIGLCLIFSLYIPAFSAGSDSSDPASFGLRIYAIIGLVCGTFLISLSNMYFFREWVKRFWYINGSITLITGGIIVYYIVKMNNL